MCVEHNPSCISPSFFSFPLPLCFLWPVTDRARDRVGPCPCSISPFDILSGSGWGQTCILWADGGCGCWFSQKSSLLCSRDHAATRDTPAHLTQLSSLGLRSYPILALTFLSRGGACKQADWVSNPGFPGASSVCPFILPSPASSSAWCVTCLGAAEKMQHRAMTHTRHTVPLQCSP